MMFFSVKVPVRIGGKTFIPCICYPLSDAIKNNIEKMVADGKAVMYPERVFFQNGKVIENPSVVKEKEEKKVKRTKKSVETEEPTGF